MVVPDIREIEIYRYRSTLVRRNTRPPAGASSSCKCPARRDCRVCVLWKHTPGGFRAHTQRGCIERYGLCWAEDTVHNSLHTSMCLHSTV